MTISGKNVLSSQTGTRHSAAPLSVLDGSPYVDLLTVLIDINIMLVISLVISTMTYADYVCKLTSQYAIVCLGWSLDYVFNYLIMITEQTCGRTDQHGDKYAQQHTQ